GRTVGAALRGRPVWNSVSVIGGLDPISATRRAATEGRPYSTYRGVHSPNFTNDLVESSLCFGHGAQTPVVDHAFVFTIIDRNTLRRSLLTELTAIRIQNIARADEQRDRRQIFQTAINRTHQITLRINISRVNFTTILQPFDTKKRINLINLQDLLIRQRGIEPW